MSFGIRLTSASSIKYCISSKTYKGQFSTDINSIAQFASLEAAIRVIKRLRKEGTERINDGVLDVVALGIEITNSYQVAQPKHQPGFFIEDTAKQVFYKGAATPTSSDVYYGWTDAIEGCRLFKSYDAALLALTTLRNEAEIMADEKTKDLNQTVSALNVAGLPLWKSRELKSSLQYKQDTADRHQERVEHFNNNLFICEQK